MTKRVVTAAITGGIHVPSLSPQFFPYVPETVIEQAVGAAKAGAAVVHIHARDPKDGRPTSDVKIFQQICRAIHDQCDVAICVTTGGGLGMTLGFQQAVIVFQVVSNQVAQDGGSGGGLPGLGIGQVALVVAYASIVNDPIQLRANGPCVVLLREIVVIENARVAEGR